MRVTSAVLFLAAADGAHALAPLVRHTPKVVAPSPRLLHGVVRPLTLGVVAATADSAASGPVVSAASPRLINPVASAAVFVVLDVALVSEPTQTCPAQPAHAALRA